MSRNFLAVFAAALVPWLVFLPWAPPAFLHAAVLSDDVFAVQVLTSLPSIDVNAPNEVLEGMCYSHAGVLAVSTPRCMGADVCRTASRRCTSLWLVEHYLSSMHLYLPQRLMSMWQTLCVQCTKVLISPFFLRGGVALAGGSSPASCCCSLRVRSCVQDTTGRGCRRCQCGGQGTFHSATRTRIIFLTIPLAAYAQPIFAARAVAYTPRCAARACPHRQTSAKRFARGRLSGCRSLPKQPPPHCTECRRRVGPSRGCSLRPQRGGLPG